MILLRDRLETGCFLYIINALTQQTTVLDKGDGNGLIN